MNNAARAYAQETARILAHAAKIRAARQQMQQELAALPQPEIEPNRP